MLFLKLFEIFIFEAFLTFWGGLNSNYSNNKDVVMIRGQMRLISSHVFILEQIIVLCLIKYFLYNYNLNRISVKLYGALIIHLAQGQQSKSGKDVEVTRLTQQGHGRVSCEVKIYENKILLNLALFAPKFKCSYPFYIDIKTIKSS